MSVNKMYSVVALFCLCIISMATLVSCAPPRVVEMNQKLEMEDQKRSDVQLKSADHKQKEVIDGKENVMQVPVKKDANVDTGGIDKEHLQKIAEAQKANGKPLSIEQLQPVDHLDAVKLEQDGMINKEYKKEVFLGNHEEIDDDEGEVAESKVKDIFQRVDMDKDGKMCSEELRDWIVTKTKEHFQEASEENEHIFKHMDPDGDGFVTWKEYYVHFLLAKGFDIDTASKQVVDYDTIDLSFPVKEQLIRYKFKWADADIEEVDNKLSQREFFAFRHPEQSPLTLNNMIDTIIESLDHNKDGILTEAEFTAINAAIDVKDEEMMKLDKEWQEERRQEFKKYIDLDGDGKATKKEMMDYMDPRNPEQAANDVKSILDQVDDDDDGCIKWEEILNNRELFINSKIVNVRKMLHDEF